MAAVIQEVDLQGHHLPVHQVIVVCLQPVVIQVVRQVVVQTLSIYTEV